MDQEVLSQQLTLLEETYPEVTTALEFSTPFELLVATVLAAQCTDKRVNRVTPALFASCPTPWELSRADLGTVEDLISSVTFYRAKARNLLGLARQIVEEHDGVVPSDLGSLVSLPGVGRKTAHVVRSYAFDLPGVVVDTHCGRLARRLGWTTQTDPVRVEKELAALLPEEDWADVPQRLVYHGRAVCLARQPQCGVCPLREVCPSALA